MTILGLPVGGRSRYLGTEQLRASAFLTKVDTGFVKRKCANKAIERGLDSIGI